VLKIDVPEIDPKLSCIVGKKGQFCKQVTNNAKIMRKAGKRSGTNSQGVKFAFQKQ